MRHPRRLFLSLTIPLCLTSLAAQKTVVVPTGYDKKAGESWMHLPNLGTGFLSYYSSSVIGLPDKAVLREIALRPRDSIHGGNGKRRIDVWLGYPHPSLRAEAMPRDRSKIVLGGQAGLRHVAKGVTVSLPPYRPTGRAAPFLIKIPIGGFTYAKARGGLIVEIKGSPVGANIGYTVDCMSRASGARIGSFQRMDSYCRGSSGYTGLVQSLDDASWVPGGHGALRLAAFSTTTPLLFFGVQRGGLYPLDLSPWGMPRCRLITSQDIWMPVVLYGGGRSKKGVAVLSLPLNPALAGARFRVQGLEVDPKANWRGVTTSSGLDIRLGTAGTRKYAVRTMYRYYTTDALRIDSAERAPVVRFTY